MTPPADSEPAWATPATNPTVHPDLHGQQIPAGARIETIQPREEYL
jgi:hypothetical protein